MNFCKKKKMLKINNYKNRNYKNNNLIIYNNIIQFFVKKIEYFLIQI